MYNPEEKRVQSGPHAGEWTSFDASEALYKAASDLQITPESIQKVASVISDEIIKNEVALTVPIAKLVPTEGHTKENTIGMHQPRNINEPIRISVDSDGKLNIEDGNHRYFTKLMNGDTDVKITFGTQHSMSDIRNINKVIPKILPYAYHKAKADGSNPKLVKIVEKHLK